MKRGKSILRHPWTLSLLAFLIACYVKLFILTARWQIEIDEATQRLVDEKRPFLVAFWHGRMLVMINAIPRGHDLRILISSHGDGLLIAKTIGYFGAGVVTGSSRRGGAEALREMRALLKGSSIIAVTPDGPRGPRMRVKPGIIKAAQLADVPIVPLAGSISRAKIFHSWDRFMLPALFARCLVKAGPPSPVTASQQDGDEEENLKKDRKRLEETLIALNQDCDIACGRTPIEPEDPNKPVKGIARRARA